MLHAPRDADLRDPRRLLRFATPVTLETGVDDRLTDDPPLFDLNPLLRAHMGATPWCRGSQRRWPSRRATPYVDARIEFDLRTAVPDSAPPKTQPKAQPRWLSAAYGSFVNKGGSNYQMSLGVVFPYEQCPELRQPDAIELIAAAWLACKPLVDLDHRL